MNASEDTKRSKIQYLLWGGLVISASLSILLAVQRPSDFYSAWLAASMWPWSICIGALTLRLILVLTGGRWGVDSLPWLNGLVRLLPLTALLFIPWAMGLDDLYSWTKPETLTVIENTENRQWYFQPTFVIARTVGYFVVWSSLSVLATGLPRFRNQFAADERAASINIPGGEGAAGLGLVVLLVSVTWAAMDWVMSLDPFFMSTLFGALIAMGAMLCGLSMLVALYCWRTELVKEIPSQSAERQVDEALPDLANLLLAFLMLWAYLSFSQFLIMWSTDLPREAAYYQSRTQGLWQYLTLVVTLGGFVIPFCCLMSHDFKRSRRKVGTLAVCLIFVRILELWWMIIPLSLKQTTPFNWCMIPTALLMVCGWLLIADSRSMPHSQVGGTGDE